MVDRNVVTGEVARLHIRPEAVATLMAEGDKNEAGETEDPVSPTCVSGWLPNGSCSGRIVADVVVSLHKARKRLRTGKLKEPRIVRQLALAEELPALLDAGKVNQSGLAHLYGLTRARVTHILNLLKLHPLILDYVRELPRQTPRKWVSERKLRGLRGLPPAAQLDEARRRLPGFGSSQHENAMLVL